MMGTIQFEGDPPYELSLAKGGRAKYEGETVKVTLPVSVPGPEPQVREIQLLLKFGHARALSIHLRNAAIEGEKRTRHGH
jgi:hypothetical protein